jgi:hypothetical protein
MEGCKSETNLISTARRKTDQDLDGDLLYHEACDSDLVFVRAKNGAAYEASENPGRG